MALRPIGQLIHADANGLLPRQGQPPSAHWQPVLDELVAQHRQWYKDDLVSIAIRGSVPRRTDVAGVSDLDLVVFVTKKHPKPANLRSTVRPTLQTETSSEVLPKFFTSKQDHWMRFALAFSGCTLWGRDIVAELPDPQLGPHCIAHLKAASRWLDDWQTYWAEDDDTDEHRAICQWLMKWIIRSLFETQMLRLNAYSRDIYPCMMAAANAYPDHEAAIIAAAELAIDPIADKSRIEDVVGRLSSLLLQEQAAQY